MERKELNNIFVDTSFVIALVNENDQNHQNTYGLAEKFENYPLVITDVILLEIGNALAGNFKQEYIEIISDFCSSSEVSIIHLNPILFQKGFELYKSYKDKLWGLIDCISFVVMREMEITDVLTFDKHFEQAGFNALMR
jgi:predicted nucleic acid-binding protein